jgi:arylsulfatase B
MIKTNTIINLTNTVSKSLQVMHAPNEVTAEFSSLFDAEAYTPGYAIYNGMGAAADSLFGNTTDALKSLDMWNNTLLVAMSDNGGPAGVDGGNANNWPLRGGKKTEFEGGVRVNAFLAGGFLPASLSGASRDGYIHVCDCKPCHMP